MNELQQVLLVFAIIVVGALYFLQRRKNKPTEAQSNHPATEASSQETTRKSINQELNNLGEPHIPISTETEHRLGIEEQQPVIELPEDNKTTSTPLATKNVTPKRADSDSSIPENQLGLSFDDPAIVTESKATENKTETEKKSKHIVLQDEDMTPVAGYEEVGQIPPEPEDMPKFGIPKDQPPASANTSETPKTTVERTDHQVFVIIIMGTEDYPWPKVNQTLQGVGLSPSELSIFAKKDSMGNEIIKVANLLEPGTFPIEETNSTEFKTPGVVMILELPTTVKAPAVMHDMIMMARKISQRLNGRMYNAERQLIKESDLQQMRDAAVAYESTAL